MFQDISRDKLVNLTLRVHNAVAKWVQNNEDIDDDLCGACAIAAVTLHKALKSLGFKSHIVEFRSRCGGFHCWVEIGNWCADPTAIQFGDYPAAYVVPKQSYDILKKYKGDTVGGAEAERSIKVWYKPHNPIRYKNKINRFLAKLAVNQNGVER